MPELEAWILHRLAEIDGAVRKGYSAYDFQGVFREIFQFATVDLSAFYFDIRKDALYCDGAASTRRRACRTVLDLLFHRLTTWLAPMLVFTAEDVWLHRYPGDESSVHLHDFPETPSAWLNPELAATWEAVRRVRRVVTGALEVERREKRIGSSLSAAPVVHIEDAGLREMAMRGDFADICITSAVKVEAGSAPDGAFTLDGEDGIAVVPALAAGTKCERCWKVLPDVGSHAHPATCERCNGALTA